MRIFKQSNVSSNVTKDLSQTFHCTTKSINTRLHSVFNQNTCERKNRCHHCAIRLWSQRIIHQYQNSQKAVMPQPGGAFFFLLYPFPFPPLFSIFLCTSLTDSQCRTLVPFELHLPHLLDHISRCTHC